MTKISQKQQKILLLFIKNGPMRSSDVYSGLLRIGEEISLVTVKRTLSGMAGSGFLKVSGSGRTTAYDVSSRGRIFADVKPQEYSSIEPDKRYGMKGFNFDLLFNMPLDIFTSEEINILDVATQEYEKRTRDLPLSIQKKELERLIIELSWKSSRIEGNTYTLLDTEKLILENREAVGHNKSEAQMILNHKAAFDFIHNNAGEFKIFSRVNLEKLHSLLVKDLSVGLGLREKPVGVLGSKYQPPDNIHQIAEAVKALANIISRMETSYAKAMTALLGISYIQPFEDGNKRTARLMANGLLLAYGRAPLSYRSVDENEYRDALLVFYELNSIVPFKKIFVEQYDFSARNYAVK